MVYLCIPIGIFSYKRTVYERQHYRLITTVLFCTDFIESILSYPRAVLRRFNLRGV